jgi:hypothetical protein
MKTMRSLILFCGAMMAVGTLAAQYPNNPSSGQQSQPQMQQPQSQPGSQMPGSQAPGSQGQQPGQPGQQSPEGRTQPAPGHPTIDDQVNMLTQDLSLTPDQQSKMRGILEDQHKQAMTIVDDPSMSRDDKIQKIRALREATIQKTRTMLDDNQKKKLDEMLNEPSQGRPSQPSGTTGTQPSTGTPGSKPQTPPPDSSKPPKF